MSSPSSSDGPQSEPPGSTSAVRPTGARSTLPGPGPSEHGAPQPSVAPTQPAGGDPDATERWEALPDFGEDIPLDSNDFERVTLVDLPMIARYGNYELLGRIAYGGMAEIFLARELGHHDTRRMMVIKRVLPHVAEDPHFVDMFVDEARLAMQLNHPNICHVYNFGEAEGTYYIAMEWVNGKPLSKIIKRAREQGGLPIPVALKITAQVAEALDYAHRAADAAGEPLGVVHRDVSPQNIMVSYDGVVKLLDFGIAKATSHSTRTEAGVIKGKFAYMSPQQCVGEPIDSRADIFALGICLFEALAGKNPFRRKTEFETMTKIVGDPTPRLRVRRPEVPEAVEGIVDTALKKQADRRFQTAGEMQVALEGEMAQLGQVINASRLGEYVSGLFADEVRDGPALDVRLRATPQPLRSTTSDDHSVEEDRRAPPPGATDLQGAMIAGTTGNAAARRRSSGMGPTALLLVVFMMLGLAGAGGVVAFLLFGDDTERTPHVAAPSLAPPPEGPSTGAPSSADPSSADPSSTGPSGANANVTDRAADPGAVVVPTAGSVFIESTPGGATIELGERGEVGTTPLDIGMIAPGAYDVRLTLDGHEPWEGQATVAEGQRATVSAQLERVRGRRPPRHAQAERDRPAPVAAAPGELSLNTRPWSHVFLGSRRLGTTPLGRVEVPSGAQRLRLVDRDGNEHERTVRVPPGGHVSESFDLRP